MEAGIKPGSSALQPGVTETPQSQTTELPHPWGMWWFTWNVFMLNSFLCYQCSVPVSGTFLCTPLIPLHKKIKNRTGNNKR
jgi:hypothetical protein